MPSIEEGQGRKSQSLETKELIFALMLFTCIWLSQHYYQVLST